MRKIAGSSPAVADEVVSRGYVDARASAELTAPSGQWSAPAVLVNGSTGTPISGTVYYEPWDVGPGSHTIQALAVQQQLAYAGTSVAGYLGVYADNGSGGQPAQAAPLVSVTLPALTTTGRKSVAVSYTFPPGRYWRAFLYVGTGQTTAPQFITYSMPINPLPLDDVSTLGITSRSWKTTGQTALPTGAVTIIGEPSTLAPIIYARAA